MDTDTYLGQLMTLPTVLYARISPDRRWIAYMWYRVHENVDVFLAPSDGSSPPVALSHTAEYTSLVNWAPDSKAVLLAEDHARDERERLFRVDLSPDAAGLPRPQPMQPLTEDRPPYFLRGGALSPDGHSKINGGN